MLRIESPPWISLVCRHWPATHKHTFDLILPSFSFKAAYLVCIAASAFAGCFSRLPDVTSKFSFAEKENVLAWAEWLPVSSHSH